MVEVNPHFVEVVFKVGEEEYTEHVTSAKFVKTDQNEVTFRDVGGKVHKRVGKPGRALQINLVQDWTTTGLARMFWESEGEQAEVAYETTEGAFSATINIVSPDPGGDSGTFAQDSLALPVDGDVTFTPGTAPAGLMATTSDESTDSTKATAKAKA